MDIIYLLIPESRIGSGKEKIRDISEKEREKGEMEDFE